MESFRHQRSPGSDRFLSLFTSPPPSSPSAASDELNEDDIFSTTSYPSSPSPSLPLKPSPSLSPSPNPSASPPSAFHRDRGGFGILAALPEDDEKTKQQHQTFRKTPISTSPTTSGRVMVIPAIPKPKPDFAISMPAGKMYQMSAPVNVPVGPPKARRGWGEVEDGEQDEEEMLPPHEIVARAASRVDSPMTTFSVLEGAGRTLKGRDLRRVRNAVFRHTGFLD